MKAEMDDIKLEGTAQEIGEFVALRKGTRGKVVTFKPTADYLPKKARKVKSKGRRFQKWDTKEDNLLYHYLKKGYTPAKIGKILERTKSSIVSRIYVKKLVID